MTVNASNAGPSKRNQLIFIGFLAAVNFLLYAPFLQNFFVTDDFETLAYLREHSRSWIDFFSISYPHARYIPFMQVLNSMVYIPFGPNPSAFHLVSLLVHTLNAMLVFRLALLMKGNFLLAGLASLVFATNAAHSEAVFWMAATPYLYAALFFLASLIVFTRYLVSKNPLHYLGSIIAFAFLLLVSEPGAVAIIALLASEVFIIGFTRRSLSPTNLIKYLPFVLIAVFHISIIAFIIPAFEYRVYGPRIGPHFFANFVTLLWFMVVPLSRTIASHLPASLVMSLSALKAASLFLLLTAGTYIAVKGANFTRFGLILLLTSILPFVWFYPGTGLFDLAPLHGTRHVYVSTIGFSLLLAGAVYTMYTLLAQRGAPYGKTALNVIVILYLLVNGSAIILWGATSWRQSSEESRSIVTQIDKIIATSDRNATFHFVGPIWTWALPQYSVIGYLGYDVKVNLITEEEANSSPRQTGKHVFITYKNGTVSADER